MHEREPNREVIIFGTGLFAKYAIACLEQRSKEEVKVAALTVHDEFIKQSQLYGKEVTPFERVLESYPPDDYDMFVAVGPKKLDGKLNGLRAEFCKQSKEKGYRLINYIHPSVEIGVDVTMGENVFISTLNSIDHFVRIGENVIFWTQNHIGHESEIGDHVFITSGVTVSGSCRVGTNSFLGVNSAVADEIKIGENNFIGMGVMVTTDTKANQVYKPSKSIPKIYEVNDMRGI